MVFADLLSFISHISFPGPYYHIHLKLKPKCALASSVCLDYGQLVDSIRSPFGHLLIGILWRANIFQLYIKFSNS